ncbi:MAG: hypothetical protein WAS07_10300 [Micropruina sp.]|nr:hypothetical protein [Micropruina sp.]
MTSPDPDLSVILEDLAAGRIDASEAARRIDALKQGEPRHAEPTDEDLAEESAPPRHAEPQGVFTQPPFSDGVPPNHRRPAGAKGVDRISVRTVGRRVRIVGDPSVATASAEGPHVLRRNGSVLEVTSDGDLGPSLDGFILRPPRSFDDLRALGLGKELLLRVNPSIAVDVEVTAGTLTTERVPYLGKVRVTAGSVTMTDIREITDALVQAGSATMTGSITTGRSRIRCESGSLELDLGRDSNVTVRGDAQLGKITWVGDSSGLDEVVLGNGSARLDVGVVMGWATIKGDFERGQR